MGMPTYALALHVPEALRNLHGLMVEFHHMFRRQGGELRAGHQRPRLLGGAGTVLAGLRARSLAEGVGATSSFPRGDDVAGDAAGRVTERRGYGCPISSDVPYFLLRSMRAIVRTRCWMTDTLASA
jgi:hypothetical protein